MTVPTRKKILRIILIVFLSLSLLCATVVLSLNVYVKYKVQGRILTPEAAAELQDIDCILVLGCSVRGDAPSPMLADRLAQGVALYNLNVSDRLLMSGDHGQEDYDEVIVMKQYAIDRGVPSEHIFMDHAGFSTYESMYRARDIYQAEKVLIVTQEYHLYRAIYIAEAMGLEAYGVPARAADYDLKQAYRDFRELLARNKDVLYTLLMPEPTYLGEALPVSGNGDLSNAWNLQE